MCRDLENGTVFLDDTGLTDVAMTPQMGWENMDVDQFFSAILSPEELWLIAECTSGTGVPILII